MDTKQILLGVLMVAIFATGFMIGRLSDAGDTIISGSRTAPSESSSKNNDTTAVEQSSDVEEDTTISTANLTDGQKSMLSAVGIDADSIVVTPEMAACADADVGAERMVEIINGATPSFSEGVKLVACYQG